MTLLAVSDENYIKYLKSLLCSIKINFSDLKVILYLIDIQDKNRIKEELKMIHSDVDFIFDDRTFDDVEGKKAYCANIRISAIYSYLDNIKEGDILLYVDADSIIRKNFFNDMNTYMKDCDVSILTRFENDDERLKVATGVIAFKKSARTKEFLKQWNDNVKPILFNWFSDQITFYKTYLAKKDKLHFKKLPQSYIDWEFNSSSCLWAGKGDRKDKNLLYTLEIKKNEKIFHNRFFFHLTLLQFVLNSFFSVVTKSKEVIRSILKGSR